MGFYPVYYNEIDPYCCGWLLNLMYEGLIPLGDVDDRPIQEVTSSDVQDYTQCHFFAGIGGWPYALRLAGWPDSRPVWTGSCPCQPFSVAGGRKGFADERDLWPHWMRLIRECRPPVCMGEQVAGAADWLARVRSDLEGVGYALGAMPIQAACAGAAQYRDRYWFVADRRQPGLPLSQCRALPGPRGGPEGGTTPQSVKPSLVGGMERPPLDGWGQGWTEPEFRSRGFSAPVASSPDGFIQFIGCPDGKWRRLPPPRVRWLGNGIPARVAKLRALGNAIYPPLAAQVILAYMEATQ